LERNSTDPEFEINFLMPETQSKVLAYPVHSDMQNILRLHPFVHPTTAMVMITTAVLVSIR
jgi:hypothetical protein